MIQQSFIKKYGCGCFFLFFALQLCFPLQNIFTTVHMNQQLTWNHHQLTRPLSIPHKSAQIGVFTAQHTCIIYNKKV